MKTNKQITIEETDKLTEKLGELFEDDDLVNGEYDKKWDKIIDKFATNLLSKLQEGVVIAEGEVDFMDNKMLIRGFRKSIAIEFENEFIREGLIILKGKKSKLIFIEDNK